MEKITIQDVAKKSGYGIGTVSRVISGDKNVSVKAKNAINKTIKELNYIPNVNGSRLKKKYTGVIAILVPVINHPFFAEFVSHLEMQANSNNYSLLLLASQMNIDKEKEILNMIRRHEIDGAIFATHYNHKDEELQNCPLVSLDRHLNDDIPIVTSDNYQATANVINKFIANGCKKIGFIGTKPSVMSEVNERFKAYQDIIKENNLEEFVVYENIKHGEERILVDTFIEKFKDLDAIFASGYTISQILYSRGFNNLEYHGKRVEFVSYDGIFTSWSGENDISCVQQPIHEMAVTAFNLLIHKIKGEETEHLIKLPGLFIEGKTTR